MAEAFAAPNPGRLQFRRSAQIDLKSVFFTDDFRMGVSAEHGSASD
jgi:hypothetical protein